MSVKYLESVVEMLEKYKYLTKNTLIFAISSFGTKFLSFFLVPLYTNVLTTSEYGIADIISTTATLMMYVCTLDIAEGVMRFVIENKAEKIEILHFAIKILLFGSVVSSAVLFLIKEMTLFEWPAGYYLLTFVYFFFTTLYQIYTSFLRSSDQVADMAVAGIVSSVGIIGGNLFFLLVMRIGLYGYLFSLILGPLLGIIYCILRAKVSFKDLVLKKCQKNKEKQILRYCIPLVFNCIALWVNAFLDKYFVTAICGLSANGLYAVAGKIPTILSTCYMVFSQAWTLSAIKEFDKDDKDGFFSNTYNLFNAFIVIACSGIILLNVPLARFLYAKDFFDAWRFSSVLLLSVMFNSLTAFLGGIFSAVKESKVIASTTILSAVANTVLNILLIPKWGTLGASIATVTAYAVMWAVRLVVLRKFISLRITLKTDIFIYLLLVIQVVLEHRARHGYLGQAIIFFCIIFVYRKYITKIGSLLKSRFKKRRD